MRKLVSVFQGVKKNDQQSTNIQRTKNCCFESASLNIKNCFPSSKRGQFNSAGAACDFYTKLHGLLQKKKISKS